LKTSRILNGGNLAEENEEITISLYNYIMSNFRRNKLRYGLTIFGLIVCVTFFIIVASLSIGLYEPTEPETPTDDLTPEERIKTEELIDLDQNVKRTIVNWLYFTAVLIFATATVAVANTMLISMIERKREIGILKSVGISRREIMQIFFTESFTICMIGFIVGVLLGLYLSNNVFNYLDSSTSNALFFGTLRTPPVVIFAAFIIVFVVGLLAGVLPALQAAKLRPIDAMRE
jgi:predicted lysophospholipase L1 biosynthesis ABC-type transport system permease subunit